MGPVAPFTPHWEALTDKTQDAFHLLTNLPFIQRFYLAGGTGLALHLGHRFSVDLDLFSPDSSSVSSDTRAILRDVFDDPTLSITHDKDATFVATWRGVGVSFFRLNLFSTRSFKAEALSMPRMIDHTPWSTMKKFLERQALAAGRQHLQDLWKD